MENDKQVDNSGALKNRYTKKLDDIWDEDMYDGDIYIYNVEEWEDCVKDGWFGNFDGSGYWVKNGFKSHDEVFSTPKLDATHVVWYSK